MLIISKSEMKAFYLHSQPVANLIHFHFTDKLEFV